MHVMQQPDVLAHALSQMVEEFGQNPNVRLGLPHLVGRQALLVRCLCRGPLFFGRRHRIAAFHPRRRYLNFDDLVAFRHEAPHAVFHLLKVATTSAPIRQQFVTHLPAQQFVDRQPCDLSFDVPQRHVHAAHRRHLHRTRAVIREKEQPLPQHFRLHRILANEAGCKVFLEHLGDSQFAPRTGGIAPSDESGLVRYDLD